MNGPAPLTSTSWPTAWTADLPVIVLVLVMTGAYLLLARRKGQWPITRTAFFLLSMTLVLFATCSFLGAYAHTLFWALAVQDVVLAALAPVPLVLSRPLQLISRNPRARPRRPSAFLGSVVVVGLLTVIYATRLDEARLRSGWVFAAVQLALIAAGCGCAGPLFQERGSAYGIRTFAAFIDGLLDAVPGLVVLASHGRIAASYYTQHPRAWGPAPSWDQQIGGSLILVLSEAVGVPVILLLLVLWARSDAEEAAVSDLVLDHQRGGQQVQGAAQPTLLRPWWETDPGPLAERLHRRGDSAREARQE